MQKVLDIRNLQKSYGNLKAVDGISFSVERGSLFAFLGLNGAGKSTTINILCTLLKKDGGSVRVAGFDLDRDPEAIRRRIGVVFQGSILDARLTVKENLTIRASFYGINGEQWKKRLDELCDRFDLAEILTRPYGKLSGGQRRRVDVARGLIHAPELLILDEPTTGLDPQTRKTVWSTVESLRQETGMTVFLTTHYMEEANRAENVVILDAGKIAAEGSPVSLKNRFSRDYLVVYTDRAEGLDAMFQPYPHAYENNAYRLIVENSAHAKYLLQKFDSVISDFEVIKGDMDDVFLNVTGKRLTGESER